MRGGEGGAEDGEGRRGRTPSLGSPAGAGKAGLVVAHSVQATGVVCPGSGMAGTSLSLCSVPLLTAVGRPPGDLGSSEPRPWLPPEGARPPGQGAAAGALAASSLRQRAPLSLLRSCWKLHETPVPKAKALHVLLCSGTCRGSLLLLPQHACHPGERRLQGAPGCRRLRTAPTLLCKRRLIRTFTPGTAGGLSE